MFSSEIALIRRKWLLIGMLFVLSSYVIAIHKSWVARHIPTLLSAFAALSTAFVSFHASLVPSIKINLGHPVSLEPLKCSFFFENLSNIGGYAKVWVTTRFNGKDYSAARNPEEKYYSGRAYWYFSGKEPIQGILKPTQFVPQTQTESMESLGIKVEVQWYTTTWLPADKLTRYWILEDRNWSLDVGGVAFRNLK